MGGLAWFTDRVGDSYHVYRCLSEDPNVLIADGGRRDLNAVGRIVKPEHGFALIYFTLR